MIHKIIVLLGVAELSTNHVHWKLQRFFNFAFFALTRTKHQCVIDLWQTASFAENKQANLLLTAGIKQVDLPLRAWCIPWVCPKQLGTSTSVHPTFVVPPLGFPCTNTWRIRGSWILFPFASSKSKNISNKQNLIWFSRAKLGHSEEKGYQKGQHYTNLLWFWYKNQ